jgi:hypothetical protein
MSETPRVRVLWCENYHQWWLFLVGTSPTQEKHSVPCPTVGG